MEAKYKVGDKVRVLHKDANRGYSVFYNEDMEEFAGGYAYEVASVFVSDIGYTYVLTGELKQNVCIWIWSEDMLEPYVEENPDTESVSGFSLYLIIGRVPGFAINTVARVNDGEPGCYVHNQYYGPDELLPFAIDNAPQLFERIYKK